MNEEEMVLPLEVQLEMLELFSLYPEIPPTLEFRDEQLKTLFVETLFVIAEFVELLPAIPPV